MKPREFITAVMPWLATSLSVSPESLLPKALFPSLPFCGQLETNQPASIAYFGRQRVRSGMKMGVPSA